MKLSKKTGFYIILTYLLLYFIISLNYLEVFPFVHSDEPWLSGLTRNMMETKSIYATETFFNLYPRYPHSIKIIFHLIQMPFILIFGYNVFAVRLISLIFAIISLFIFYQISVKLFKNYVWAILATILFSLNIQFIYASHFARQEIILVFFFMLGFLHYLQPLTRKATTSRYLHSKYFFRQESFLDAYEDAPTSYAKFSELSYRTGKANPHLLLGLIIGTSIGIHPNSFLIALIFGLLYLLDLLRKTKKVRDLIILVTTTGLMGLLFVILSFIGDPKFISHYTNYGNTLGVSSTLVDKLLTIPDYYKKLYDGISGTYYTPPIQIYFILFAVITIASIAYLIITSWINKRDIGKSISTSKWILVKLLLCILGINIGFIIIGRYNQTNIIFIYPFFYLLAFTLLQNMVTHYKQFALWSIGIIIVLTSFYTYKETKPYTTYSYGDYLNQLNVIPPSAKTLGNLNTEFYFENGALLDYRNLTHLEEMNVSFSDYMHENEIKYIIYTEELDYIHRNPSWNVLYGEDAYYEEMNQFIEDHCTLIHEFGNALYGIRIPIYMFDYDWGVKIYRVK